MQGGVLRKPLKEMIVEWMIVEYLLQNLELQYFHCSLPLFVFEVVGFEIRNYLALKVCWQSEREEGRRSMLAKEPQM